MPDAQTIRTYDLIASQYAKKHWHTGERFNRLYSNMSKILGKGSLILDAGCGPGRDSLYFLRHGYRVIGVDASDGMIKEAKKRVPAVNFLKMDLEKLRFKKNTFDGIWAIASVLHVRRSKISEVLVGFHRILKDGGIVFISVKRGFGDQIKSYPDGFKKYFAYYTKKELTELLRSAGFREIRSFLDKDEKGTVWIDYLGRKV